MKNKTKKTNSLFSVRYLFYDFVKITGVIPGYIWLRPKLRYINAKARRRIRGGALVISNHRGFIDPIYLQFAIWYRRHRFVCLESFFKGKKAWLFRAFLCIPIDKENVSLDSVRDIIAHLENDELVTIFPEGQVNDGTGEMAAFKSGVVLMALRSGKPIVPIYIKERKHFLSRLTAAIGEPIDINEVYKDVPMFKKLELTSKMLEEKEEELKNYLQEVG